MSLFAQRDIKSQLRAGMTGLALEPSGEAVESLARYIGLLARWNETFNLIGPCSPEEMVVRHVLDSLTALPYVSGATVLDIGTGAGLPGIPLAVLDLDRRYTLLDSRGKKTRFVTEVIGKLGLDNVSVVQDRVETFSPGPCFDTLITRAFSSLEIFVRSCQRLVAAEGRLVAMKGHYPDEELKPLRETVTSIEVSSVLVPGLDAERHVVIIQP